MYVLQLALEATQRVRSTKFKALLCIKERIGFLMKTCGHLTVTEVSLEVQTGLSPNVSLVGLHDVLVSYVFCLMRNLSARRLPLVVLLDDLDCNFQI